MCYIRPQGAWNPPTSPQEGIVENSDYMLLARSDGIIEIHKDYQYKLDHYETMVADFELVCDFTHRDEVDGREFSIVALEYKQGLLYCCTQTGQINVFILNLPSNYAQARDMIPCTQQTTDPGVGFARSSSQAAQFFLNIKFTGRTRFKHICYYLDPVSAKHRGKPSMAPARQGHTVPYRQSFYIESFRMISRFRVNPLDALSYFMLGQDTGLAMHKIRFPSEYLRFLTTIKGLRDSISGSKSEGLISNETEPDGPFNVNTVFDTQDQYSTPTEDDIMFRRSVRANNGIPELKSFPVWMQKNSSREDDIQELFAGLQRRTSTGKKRDAELRKGLHRSPEVLRNDRPRSNSLRRGILSRSIETTHNPASWLPIVASSVSRNDRPTDFDVYVEGSAQVNEGIFISEEESSSDEEIPSSFLTPGYKSFEIVAIGRFVSITATRPRLCAEPYMRINSFHNSTEMCPDNDESKAAFSILNNFHTFKRVFVIDKSLCLMIGVNGVLLLDRTKMNNTKDVLANAQAAVKVIGFNFGVLNDVAISITDLQSCRGCCKCGGDVSLRLDIIVTCLTGHILALKARFDMHHRVGSIELKDCVINRNVDQITLIHRFEATSRKRESSSDNVSAASKRSRHA